MSIDLKKLKEDALRESESFFDTPISILTRKIINQERAYLYASEGVNQRLKKIKDLVEDHRLQNQLNFDSEEM